MRDTVSVSYQLLKSYSNDSELELMAFAIWLKSFHSNSTFYNFSYRTLAKKTSVSVGYLQRVLPLLESQGWIVFRDGNMTVRSQKKVAERREIDNLKNIPIKTGKSWRDVLDELRYVIYGSKASQLRFKFNKRLRGDDITNAGVSTLGIIRESLYLDNNVGQTQISYEGLSKLWGCSKTTAFNQIKKWVSNGKIVKHNIQVDSGYDVSMIGELSSMCGSFFVKNGVVIKQLANVYCYS